MKWLLVILFLCCSAKAQTTQQSAADQNTNAEVSAVIQKIEKGISNCSVDEFENELGMIVSIAIGSSEGGYYSMNQTASVLIRYFSERRCVSFEFSSIHKTGPTPYATGRFVYIYKGNQDSAQIYVSLKQQDSKWVINRFNIY